MSRRPRGSRACDDATAQCDNDSDISVHPAPRPRDVCRVTGSSAVVWGHESRNDCGPLAQQGSSLSSALCSIVMDIRAVGKGCLVDRTIPIHTRTLGFGVPPQEMGVYYRVVGPYSTNRSECC